MAGQRLDVDICMTTERRIRWRRPWMVAGLSAGFLILAGAVVISWTGAGAAKSMPYGAEQSDGDAIRQPSELQSTDDAASVNATDTDAQIDIGPIPEGDADTEPAFSGPAPSAVDVDSGLGRFVALQEPYELLRAATDPSTGNATGFSVHDLDRHVVEQVEGWANERILAVVADVAVSGDGPGTVLVHPGDRPTEAFRLQLSDSGQLRVPQLLLRPDGQGRVVVAADPKEPLHPTTSSVVPGFEIVVTARAVYVESGATTSGRYRHVGLAGVASLVTAIDGQEVTLDLAEISELDAAQVGHAALRLNANVGDDGGSVAYLPTGRPDDAGTTIATWSAPTQVGPGLGGTGVAVVPVDGDGRIRLRYTGGSIMNVDLIGYFTNDRAEQSTSGLLMPLTPRELDVGADRPPKPGVDLVVAQVQGSAEGGAVLLGSRHDVDDEQLVFNLGSDQLRAGPLWLSSAADVQLVDAPQSTIWLLGHYEG